MNEMVFVGEKSWWEKSLPLPKKKTTVQVYEETSGLMPGELVEGTGGPITVTLAPGILNNIFDGIERPLEAIAESYGVFIPKGAAVSLLDRKKKWETHLTVMTGQQVSSGTILAEVPETRSIVHKVMIPPELKEKLFP